MAETVAENVQFTGRLGLDSRDSGTLAAAVSVVVDALEDFGHPAEAIEARAENAARLQCDTYLVALRLRRVPLRRARRLASHVMQPTALLDLSLTPAFPEHCDREISELVLAEILRRLIAAVEATSVEWLQAPVVLSCDQFLSAFDPAPAPKSEVSAEQNGDTSAQSNTDTSPLVAAATAPPAAGPTAIAESATAPQRGSKPRRLRGRACFTPIEQAAPALEAHCDRVFRAAGVRRGDYDPHLATQRARARRRLRDADAASAYRKDAQAFLIGGTLQASTVSTKQAFGTGGGAEGRIAGVAGITQITGGLVRRLSQTARATLSLGDMGRMRFVGHLLLLSALLLFLDSAGTVQAARPLLP